MASLIATPLGGGPFSYLTGSDYHLKNRQWSPSYSGYVYQFDGVGSNPLFSFAGTGTSMVIDFTSLANQHAGDEFFAIDNVVVTEILPVPAPAALFVFLIGLMGLRAYRTN